MGEKQGKIQRKRKAKWTKGLNTTVFNKEREFK